MMVGLFLQHLMLQEDNNDSSLWEIKYAAGKVYQVDPDAYPLDAGGTLIPQPNLAI